MTTPPKKPITSFDTPNTGKPRDRDSAPESGRSCLWRFINAGVWVGLVLILLMIGFRVWFLSRFDAPTRAKMDQLENEIIILPPDWQTAAAIPPGEVVDAQTEFRQEMGRLAQKHFKGVELRDILERLYINDDLTSSEQKMVPELLAEIQPLVEKTSSVVTVPGYTVSLPLYVNTNYSSLQSFAKICDISAILTAQKGDYRHAFDMAVLPVRLMRHEPRSAVILHLMSCAIVNLSSDAIYNVTNECNTLTDLRYAMTLMDQVQDIAHPRDVNLWEYADWAESLSAMKATGYPINLSPQSLASFQDQAMERDLLPFNQWVVENLPATDTRVVQANQFLDEWKERSKRNTEAMSFLETQLIAHRNWVEIILGYKLVTIATARAGGAAWMDDARNRAKVSSLKFDLARLRIAQRIAELETTSDSAATTGTIAAAGRTSNTVILGPDAIAAIMPTIPDDPFSSPTAPLRFSNSQNRFYSLGPDDDDDGMAIKYDPSNGTVSGGDVFLSP